MIRSTVRVVLCSVLLVSLHGVGIGQGRSVQRGPALQPSTYRHYFETFAQQEQEALGERPPVPWQWFADNIPFIDVPDKHIEEMYYFRWYAFQKHIHQTPRGTVIDEFLDDVPWAGRYNSIDAAAGHQLREARWLRDRSYAESYARFWFGPDGDPRRYSFWAAASVYAVYAATGDKGFALDLYPKLIQNYEAWERSNRDPNGLFYQIDDRDGMEKSIGGSGYRPTINSYMYGDAIAIADLASLAGDEATARIYRAKATTLKSLIERYLWNPHDQFFETVPRGDVGEWSGTRELTGYVPWYFSLPDRQFDVAWKQLFNPNGFAGRYGPTTAERRSPRYRFQDEHECLWNGPSWPFATTQTLVALANLLQDTHQKVMSRGDYLRLFTTYTQSQYLRLANGQRIPWIDEDLDPDTGEWLARDILQARHQLPANRGRYYNHSGYSDLLITGLFGLRPQEGNTITVDPLLPSGTWRYFMISALPYHGHTLTLLFDQDGSRYHQGRGLRIYCDGVLLRASPVLQAMTAQLPDRSR